jgi:transposase
VAPYHGPDQARALVRPVPSQAKAKLSGATRRIEHQNALGNPLAFFLTAGQGHDLQGADVLLPQMQANTLLADKALMPMDASSSSLLAAGKKFVIPPKSNRKLQRPYDKQLYKARHLMENFYCKLKQYRAIATRYDKTARNFLAGIHLAAAVIWLN